jgi:beta-phosphoglucomutase-like phosphatase (HAD superfamily)/dTDP-glucose pyrophosphorylase
MAIRLVCFDYDGVCADLRDTHYQAFNQALSEIDPKFIITREEQLSVYDGLSTKRKLHLLTMKGLDEKYHGQINLRKQELTLAGVSLLQRDERLIGILTELRSRGYKTHLTSNAIHDTIYHGLLALGVWSLFDRVFSNEDVENQKPHPEIYLRSMIDAGVSPQETLIVEDSKHGREAAYQSGAFVLGVDCPADLTLEKVEAALNVKPKPKRWVGGGITVLVPMSGAGSRFVEAGYKLPKPLIDVGGKPMIQRVVENIGIEAKYVFVVQKNHYDGYYLGTLLNSIAPGCEIIQTDGMTEGAACSCLLAKELIDDNHLIIANSDQWVDWNPCDFMWSMVGQDVDGGILTFRDNNPKWSYAREENGLVVEVAEKKVISNNATVGIYYYKRGKAFVKYAEQMISKGIRTNGEFYVCPIFNELIADGGKVKIHSVGGMFGMGTPDDLRDSIDSGIFNVRR